MWTIFGILLLLLSVAIFVLRHAFPIPLFARHCYWFGGAFLFLFLALQLWFWLSPRPTPFTANESQAVRSAVIEALEKAEKAGVSLPATAAVVHFVSDPTDEATAIFRTEIAARDGWTAVTGSPAVAFLKGLAKTLYEATSVDEYLMPGRRVGIDVLFYGTVRAVSTLEGVSRANLFLTAYDTRTGKEIFSEETEATYPRVRTAAGRAVAAHSRSGRWWLFAILVAILPWLSAPVTLRVLARGENRANAVILSLLVAADIILGLFLFFDIASHIATAILIVLLCLAYDVFSLEVLSRRATR